MRSIVVSLMRLYDTGKITKSILEERVAKGTITAEELGMIVGNE